jgi:hypothetical protein
MSDKIAENFRSQVKNVLLIMKNHKSFDRKAFELGAEHGEGIWRAVEGTACGEFSCELVVSWRDSDLDASEALEKGSVQHGDVRFQSLDESFSVRSDCFPFLRAFLVLFSESGTDVVALGERVLADERSGDDLLDVAERALELLEQGVGGIQSSLDTLVVCVDAVARSEACELGDSVEENFQVGDASTRLEVLVEDRFTCWFVLFQKFDCVFFDLSESQTRRALQDS